MANQTTVLKNQKCRIDLRALLSAALIRTPSSVDEWVGKDLYSRKRFQDERLINPLYRKLPTISGFYGECWFGRYILMSGRR